MRIMKREWPENLDIEDSKEKLMFGRAVKMVNS